jgi:hypothetical protein
LCDWYVRQAPSDKEYAPEDAETNSIRETPRRNFLQFFEEISKKYLQFQE